MTFVSINFHQKSRDGCVKILQEKLYQSRGENWKDGMCIIWNGILRGVRHYISDIWILYKFYLRNCTDLKVRIEKWGMCHLKWNLMRRETFHTIFSLKCLPDRMIRFAAGPRAGWGLACCTTSCLTRQKYIQKICRWCVGDVVEQVVWHVTEYRVTVDMGCWDFTT